MDSNVAVIEWYSDVGRSASEVEIAEPPRLLRESSRHNVIGGAIGGWYSLDGGPDEHVVRGAHGELVVELGGDGYLPVESDTSLDLARQNVVTPGVDVISILPGNEIERGFVSARAFAYPRAFRLGPHEWLVVGRSNPSWRMIAAHIGPGVAQTLVEITREPVTFSTAWGGRGRILVLWSPARADRPVSLAYLDARTMTLDPIEMPVPLGLIYFPDLMFHARTDALVLTDFPRQLAIVRDDRVTLLDLGSIGRANLRIHGRPGTNVAFLTWSDEAYATLWLAPLVCD